MMSPAGAWAAKAQKFCRSSLSFPTHALQYALPSARHVARASAIIRLTMTPMLLCKEES